MGNTRRKSILMLTDFYPPTLGGLELQVQKLSLELAERGYHVQVATIWQAGLPDVEHDRGVLVYRLKGLTTAVPWFSKDPRRRFHPPFPDPAVVWGLRRLIRHRRPDVIHAQGWIVYSAAVARAGTGIPLLASVRDHSYICAVRDYRYNGERICDGPELGKCLRCARHAYGPAKSLAAVTGVYGGRALLSRNVSGLHSISRYIQRLVDGDRMWRRVDAARRAMIHDLFDDAARPRPYRPAAALGLPDEPYILFVGALGAHKGIHQLLAAYRQLDSKPPLVLIGTPWHDSPTEFPAGVTVLRNVPNAAVLEAWERALFGVAPSTCADALNGAIAEAMSQGRPVIGTSVGGIGDLVLDSQTGLLVPPDDITALANAMRRLLADGELRARLGRNARAHVRPLTPELIIPHFEALYQSLESTQGRRQ